MLQEIQLKRDSKLVASMALVNAHKLAEVPDREAIQELESSIKIEVDNCGEVSLYHASLYMWLAGDNRSTLVKFACSFGACCSSRYQIPSWQPRTFSECLRAAAFFPLAVTAVTAGQF
jgi:hypothetical protein